MAGLSDGFVYAPKPPAAPAANIRVTVPPSNKDRFSVDNDTIMFNIPCGKRGQYMNTRMSYLKFDLEVECDWTSGNTVQRNIPVIALDGGAHALFNTLEVFHGSNLLEQIREYSSLHQLMLDIGESSDGAKCGRSVAEGTTSGGYGATPFANLNEYAGGGYNRNGTLLTPICLSNNQTNLEVAKLTQGGSVITHYNDGIVTTLDATTHAITAGADNRRPITFHSGGLADAELAASANADESAHCAGSASSGAPIKVRYTFCIPLVSGIVGAQMPKYLPVGALANDIRLELGLNTFANAVKTIAVMEVSTTHAGKISIAPQDIFASRSEFGRYKFAIERAELQLEYIEVASDVQMAIEAATGGQYVVSFDSFYDYQSSVPASSVSMSQLIGAKFSSIKTVMSVFRDQFVIGNPAAATVTSRVNPFGTKNNRPMIGMNNIPFSRTRYDGGCGWQYQIGATQYPPRPVQSDEEAYMEAVKSQHSVASQQRSGIVDHANWTVSARRDADAVNDIPSRWYQMCAQGGTYFCAQNLESQSHKSHLAESGVNTLAQSMYLHTTFPSAADVSSVFKVVKSTSALDPADGAYGRDLAVATGGTFTLANTISLVPWRQTNQALRVDHFIHYDGILIVSNGICSTRF
jgi:hypothetical protein